MHKRFEELCALAATGQITGDAMAVLDQHVKECDACRAFLQDLVPLKAHVAPVVAASHARTFEVPEGIRERFFQRAAAAGVELHPGPAIAPERSEVPAPVLQPSLAESLSAAHARIHAWYHPGFRFGLAVAVAVVCGFLGYLVAQYQSKKVAAQVLFAPAPNPTPLIQATASPNYSVHMAKLQEENVEARRRLVEVSADLANAQAEKKELERRLSLMAQRVSAAEGFEQEFKAVAQRLQDSNDRVAQLQTELDVERNKAANADAVLVAQQMATEEANSKLANLQAQLDREHELNSVKGSAGDLIAARNLHIVDVYDTEDTGERKRAFGRVFYVEGRSLVFYAYDLASSKHAKRQIQFRVWGEQAGVKSVSVNLGVMHNDSAVQARWVLTCDDPKVLSRINAIYISPDANSRSDSEPRGQKMMYAFLGSPNHP